MKKINLILLIFTIFYGCNWDDDSARELSKINVVIQHENVYDRFSRENLGIVPLRGIRLNSTAIDLKSSNLKSNDVVSDLPLALVAEVAAPVYEGFTLRASHVCINGTHAYVSYNYEGDKYLGAVDLIDITDPIRPQLIESAIFPDMDISSVSYKNNKLYLAGAKNFQSEGKFGPAVFLKMKLENGFLSREIDVIGMPGYVATDLVVDNNYIYTVSGDNGILGAYNHDDNVLKSSVFLNDLRSVGINSNKVVTLRNGRIHVFDPLTLTEIISFATNPDIAEAKRTIDFYGGSVLATEGPNGVSIYNLSSGTKLKNIPVGDAIGLDVDPSEVVSNAVSVNNEHLFIANGAAGISILKISSGKIENLINFGSLDLAGSANYVKSEDEYVFVADGLGGLKILKLLSVDPGTGAPVGDCTQYPSYTGGNWLNVNSNENQSYNGAASLAGINVNAKLTWCGSLAVSENININSGGYFIMKGSLATGSPGKSVIINSGSVLSVEGSLVVFGNLVLNSNATIEFLGSGSTITVFGSVTKSSNVTINGVYTDTFNSLK